MNRNSHISDRDLLMAADRELSARRTAEVHKHLAECWMCRTRMKEIDDSIVDFMHAYRKSVDPQLPPADASRALLKVRLGELAAERPAPAWRRHLGFVFTRSGLVYASCSLVFLLVLVTSILHSRRDPLDERLLPNHGLTPGATRLVAETDVCAPSRLPKSPPITSATARRVFEEYGIDDPQPRGYELDYLIDPELGGSGDPSNLWPQPYSVMWNARIKDALEDRLHDLVCTNQVTLAAAQRDIATDWIAAYKNYFQTDTPIANHLAFIKDEPWSY